MYFPNILKLKIKTSNLFCTNKIEAYREARGGPFLMWLKNKLKETKVMLLAVSGVG